MTESQKETREGLGTQVSDGMEPGVGGVEYPKSLPKTPRISTEVLDEFTPLFYKSMNSAFEALQTAKFYLRNAETILRRIHGEGK